LQQHQQHGTALAPYAACANAGCLQKQQLLLLQPHCFVTLGYCSEQC
jgi:hypothetical protein